MEAIVVDQNSGKTPNPNPIPDEDFEETDDDSSFINDDDTIFEADEEPIFDIYDSSSIDEDYHEGEPIFDVYEEDENTVFEVVGDGGPVFDIEHMEEDIITGDGSSASLFVTKFEEELQDSKAVSDMVENEVNKGSAEEVVEDDGLKITIFQSTYAILEKINPIAYKLKLPNHFRTDSIFNVKHVIPSNWFLCSMVKIRGRILSNRGRMMQWMKNWHRWKWKGAIKAGSKPMTFDLLICFHY